jgi:hypothetical protein
MGGVSTRLAACAAGLLLTCAPGAGAAPTDGLAGCDPIDPAVCMLPFPNDRFTVADASTPTGRRIAFRALGMPRNLVGRPIDPSDHRRADGFSPGSPIITKVPGLQTTAALRATGAAPITDIARSLRRAAPIVLLDADTGRRHPYWAEVDMSVDRDADRTLIVRPARNLLEGHRYVVALRRLRSADGRELQAQEPFRLLRDGSPSAEAGQVRRYDRIFADLRRAGVAREDLYLAWDFTVASARSLAGRMLAIRDDAFAQLGDHDLGDGRIAGRPPRYELTTIEDRLCGLGIPVDDLSAGFLACGLQTTPKVARDIKGTMEVPCYLDVPGCLPVHSQFLLGDDGLPVRLPGNTMQVEFECRVPTAAVAGGTAHPTRIALYGHGLFGSKGEVRQGQLQDFGNEHAITFCATDWAGMATVDVPNVVTILTDLSSFPTLADRVQQGMLNALYLGRLLAHPDGLAADPAFALGGRRLLDTRRLFYDGNSQGGIIGGALTAVAPDFTRATLGVPGMNYSTLLTRSVDFGTGRQPDLTALADGDLPFEYAYPLYTSYPRQVERQLVLALMQMLWDRAEPDGYAQHMTSDPYPGTPAHRVMLHVALGDHQVAPVTAEVEARTIGARLLRRPAVAPGRSPDVVPQWGIPAFRRLPGHGSALVIWDSGSPVPPTTSTPPAAGHDPHEDPRNSAAARAMKSAFFAGRVVDTCGRRPCTAAPRK